MNRVHGTSSSPLLRSSLGVQTGPPRALLLRLPGEHLGSIVIGISARQLLGIQPAGAFASSPCAAPDWIGMAEWSLNPVHVVDLASCLGLGPSDGRLARRLAFVRCPRHAAALAVPVLSEMTLLENTDDARPACAAPPMAAEFLRGVFRLGPEQLLVPDLDAILERVLSAPHGSAEIH